MRATARSGAGPGDGTESGTETETEAAFAGAGPATSAAAGEEPFALAAGGAGVEPVRQAAVAASTPETSHENRRRERTVVLTPGEFAADPRQRTGFGRGPGVVERSELEAKAFLAPFSRVLT
jgi:hypothetical protein